MLQKYKNIKIIQIDQSQLSRSDLQCAMELNAKPQFYRIFYLNQRYNQRYLRMITVGETINLYSLQMEDKILEPQNFVNVFKKINWLTKQYLNQITILYKNNQISYSVIQFQETLLRLLTPLQIKGVIDNQEVFHIISNSKSALNLLKESKIKSNSYFNASPNQSNQNVLKNLKGCPAPDQNNFYNYNQYSDKFYEDELNFQSDIKPSQYLRSQQFRSVNNPSKRGRKNNQAVNILIAGKMKKGVKSGGLEQQLLCWIRQEHLDGKVVGRVQTMDKARQIGRCIDFRGSTGWYSNFIRRNPDIREILKRGNSIKRQINKLKEQNDDDMMIKERDSSQYNDFSYNEGHNEGGQDYKQIRCGIYSENEQSSDSKVSDNKQEKTKKSDGSTKL